MTDLRVEPVAQTVTRSTRPALLLLLGAGVFVLLIATVNIANLLLSRATARQREIAIRAAVGAGRMRVTRQLLVEGIVLALAGGAVGLLVAQGAIAILIRLSAYTIPRLVETTIDARVLGFALAASFASGLLFGAGPAIALLRTNLHDALKAGARSSAGPQGIRLRKLLVGAELAMAMVLLAGAGLLLKSFWRMTAHPPGSAPEKVLVMKFRLAGPQYRERPGQKRYIRELERRLEQAPGIEAAGVGNWALWAGAPAFPSDPSPDQTHLVRFTTGSPGYVKALGMRLVKGRWLTEDDSGDNVLLNESLARIAFGSVDPIGHKLFTSGRSNTVVVGVVSDLKYFQLDEAAPPEMYVGLQFQSPFFPVGGTIAVRTATDPLALVPTIRKMISGIDPTQPVYHIETLEQALSESIAPRHFHLFLLGSFAAAALLLAVVGIYGTLAYSVAQRTREIGVRLALGAQRGGVVATLVREGMWIALAGIAVGLGAALALAPLVGKLLYDVKPNDPWALAAVAASLALTAFAACFVPATKAARIDPAITLRYE
ncbi:MAG: FtsX-like permease family protein [Acidobacteriia bacterium]|nr:FtsX-like permease family protein [Terriglobia bacterium]